MKRAYTTDSYSKCMCKLVVYAATIFVELVCGGIFISDAESSILLALFLAIFVQSVNNIYDAFNYLDPNKYTSFVIVRQTIVAACSTISLVLSLIYMYQIGASTSEKELLESFNSKKYWIGFCVASIILSLVIEVLEYLFRMVSKSHQIKMCDTNKVSNNQNSNKILASDVVYYLYEYDEADNWPDKGD